MRGTELLTKLVEETSFESVVAELASRSNGCDFKHISPEDRLKLFVAIVNGQRTTLIEERERLR